MFSEYFSLLPVLFSFSSPELYIFILELSKIGDNYQESVSNFNKSYFY